MGQESTKSNLFLKFSIGQTQTHELFDFQSGGFSQQELAVQSSSFIVDKGQTIEFIPEELFIKSNDVLLDQAIYKITLDDHQQITFKQINQNSSHALWRVIQPGEPQTIAPGDIIKIGKIKLQLKKIVQKKEQNNNEQETVKDFNEDQLNDELLQSAHSNHSNLDRCRICFSSSSKQANPLLCLCKCSGSIKWVHFLCLKDWVANSFSKREDQHCKFYTYFETNCQLCKEQLPNQFQHEGKWYSFLDFKKFEPPYADFQYTEIENNKKKFYKYVINLQKDKEVVIGRGNNSQIIMKDISISRTHCSIQYKQGILILRDKKSKFGTLIKVDKNIEFSSQNGLQLQFDSKIIKLYNKNTFKTCCRDVDSYRLVYESCDEQNHKIANISNRENYSETLNLLNTGIVRQQRLETSERNNQRSQSQNMEEIDILNILQNSLRNQSERSIMVRQTIARDEGEILY